MFLTTTLRLTCSFIVICDSAHGPTQNAVYAAGISPDDWSIRVSTESLARDLVPFLQGLVPWATFTMDILAAHLTTKDQEYVDRYLAGEIDREVLQRECPRGELRIIRNATPDFRIPSWPVLQMMGGFFTRSPATHAQSVPPPDHKPMMVRTVCLDLSYLPDFTVLSMNTWQCPFLRTRR